jgi:hypothetical protein
LSPDASRIAMLTRIARAARRTELRMRSAAALEAFVSMTALSLVAVALAFTLAKVVPGFERRWALDVVAGAGLAVFASTAFAATRRLPKLAGAMALDAHHRLSDRLTSALSFSAVPSGDRTALMEVAMDDACDHAGELSPRRAMPLAWPRDLPAALGLLLGVALIVLIQVRTTRTSVHAKTIEPAVLSADDIDLFREVGKKLADVDKNPDVLAALQAYNQLVEDLAQKRLDRNEAFRRMHEIETQLMEGRSLDAKTLDEQLKLRASALKKSDLSRPLAEALEQSDLPKAEQKMRELAKRLREKPDAQAKAQLERLREAMKKAAEGQKERMAALQQRREELAQQLLMQKQQSGDGGVKDEEQSLLQRKERELERLDREQETEARAGRQLDRLDRDLAEAAEDLMRQAGLSASDLDRGAEDINRLAQEKMSDEEREELRQRLEDLREQLRQEGQGGEQRMMRLRRFARQAKGQGSGRGGQKQPCPPGDPNCKPEEGESGEDQEGQGQGQGQGSEGETFTIGPGGQKILTISRGQGQGQGQGLGQGEGQSPGQGAQGQGEGHGAGDSHDPNGKGQATGKNNPSQGTIEVHEEAHDTGQGPSRSEAILGAAEKGFKGRAYKKVYTEYHTSAEDQIHQDKIPPGTNDHIRRYFDLIRPRE